MMEPVKVEEGSIYFVDKTIGWTSFDVVRKLRKITGIRKVGHAGTLDPLATGLLLVCTGAMTKRIAEYMEREKEYTGTFMMGKSTDSFDLETEVRDVADCMHLGESHILQVAESFVGEQLQIPPAHSAIKIGGRRSYLYARSGKDPGLSPRPVSVADFEITDLDLPEVHFRLVCSKGYYVRSLARDFGDKLGVGAYLAALRRTRIGEYKVADALTITQLEEKLKIKTP